MFNFALLIAISNLLGGRWVDVVGEGSAAYGRLAFRCIIPGILAGALAWGDGFAWYWALYTWAAVTLGSAVWFAPGWSFDEITGGWSPSKYPAIIRRFALWLIPNINSASCNRLRGTLLKSIRGLYDVVTFAGLYVINPMAPAYLVGTVLMGPIYWLAGRLNLGRHAVLVAEFFSGALRGILIGLVITGG